MKRFQRVAQLWDWLPAFRAAAEHQSLSVAAKDLGVSTSAVSRTVGLLEEAVGKPVFHRHGRRVSLNPAGEALLTATRDGMRLVDEALELIAQRRFTGPLKIAVSDTLISPFVLSALASLTALHSGLRPELTHVSAVTFDDLLRRGEIDVAFGPMPNKPRELQLTKVGTCVLRVYGVRGHPALRRAVRPSDPFVAQRTEIEGWPLSAPRDVVLRVDGFDAALASLLTSGNLAVLPEAFTQDAHRAGRIGAARHSFRHRLDVYAVSRTPLPWPTPVDELVSMAQRRFPALRAKP